MQPLIEIERKRFHEEVFAQVLSVSPSGIPSNADKDNAASRKIATGIVERLQLKPRMLAKKPAGQTVGNEFEECCRGFVAATFPLLSNVRPGKWAVERITGRGKLLIANFEQYAHLRDLDDLAAANEELKAALGTDYTIAPDVVVLRSPEPDTVINDGNEVVGDEFCVHASLRKLNNKAPLLHASLSCKWTIRSDRSQNSRAEALNLLRNRKGRAPHICVITAEPTPSRLASVALGTGDLDCVYHFALHELEGAVEEYGEPEAVSMLRILIDGKRLRDISDLPLDLAI